VGGWGGGGGGGRNNVETRIATATESMLSESEGTPF